MVRYFRCKTRQPFELRGPKAEAITKYSIIVYVYIFYFSSFLHYCDYKISDALYVAVQPTREASATEVVRRPAR